MPMISASVLDHERRPKPAWAAVVEACRPVIVVCDALPEIVQPGQTLTLDVHVVSDLREALAATVAVTASWPGGSQQWGFRGEVEADDCALVGRITIDVPDVDGELLLGLALDGRTASGDPVTATPSRSDDRDSVTPRAAALRSREDPCHPSFWGSIVSGPTRFRPERWCPVLPPSGTGIPGTVARSLVGALLSSGYCVGMTTVLDRRSATSTDRPTSHLVGAAVLFAGVTVAVAVLGSLATSSGRPWYDELEKPVFNPPDATFGVVWTILYAMIAFAGWLAWKATDDLSPTIAWLVQMALNLGWTVVFFGWRAPEAAIVVIAALLVAVAVDLVLSWRASIAAGALLVPYLAWVGFAAALNIGVAVLN